MVAGRSDPPAPGTRSVARGVPPAGPTSDPATSARLDVRGNRHHSHRPVRSPAPSRAAVDRPGRRVERPSSVAGRGLWFVATIGLFVGSILAGGTRSVEAVSNDERAKYEAGEAYVVYGEANAAAGQQAPASQQFLLLVSSAERTVDDPAFQAALGDITGRLAARPGDRRGRQRSGLRAAPRPDGPRRRRPDLISPDRTTVRIVARVPGDGAVARPAAGAGPGRARRDQAPLTRTSGSTP